MSVADQEHTHPAHAAAWELLPWYHGDTLLPAQRALVEAHLGECLVCTREVRRLRQLALAMAAPGQDHASAQAFRRLTARIESGERGWRARLRGLLAGLVTPAPALAGLGVVALALLLVMNQPPPAETPAVAQTKFQTLGRAARLDSTLEQPLLRVVLKDGVVRAARDAWLARHGAELVDGPSAIGVMTVRLALGPRRLEQVIAAMREQPDTLFVEPLGLGGSRPDRRR